MRYWVTFLLLALIIAFTSGFQKRESAEEPGVDLAEEVVKVDGEEEAEESTGPLIRVRRDSPRKIVRVYHVRRNKKGATHYRFRHNKFRKNRPRGRRSNEESEIVIGNPVIIDDSPFNNDTDSFFQNTSIDSARSENQTDIDLESEFNKKQFHFNFLKHTKRSAEGDLPDDRRSEEKTESQVAQNLISFSCTIMSINLQKDRLMP
ncbi:hypothetical protein SK128_023858 [Halocaridina rubra]|uniref:Uncharacterized protein n=1 Tax=Halocaridina rubra TaxID=373956 RepID=A0AAN8WLH0_HALRR